LSYDFYLPSYNLLIEYQGEYHDGTANNQSKDAFLRQQEHDKRKLEYSVEHNIELLEIWYYDFENIENILQQYTTK
jgi:very-short-patch-repair endonuclease